MDAVWIVGLVAIIVSSSQFLPQIVKTFRLKKADQLSPYFLAWSYFAQVLWFSYAYLRGDRIIMLSCLSFTVFIMGLTLGWWKYGRVSALRRQNPKG